MLSVFPTTSFGSVISNPAIFEFLISFAREDVEPSFKLNCEPNKKTHVPEVLRTNTLFNKSFKLIYYIKMSHLQVTIQEVYQLFPESFKT